MESQRHHNQKKKNKTLMSVKYLAICPAMKIQMCFHNNPDVGSIILQNFSVNKAAKVHSN
jgi:hypothetical protein